MCKPRGASDTVIYSRSEAVINDCQKISFQALLLLCVRKGLVMGKLLCFCTQLLKGIWSARGQRTKN